MVTYVISGMDTVLADLTAEVRNVRPRLGFCAVGRMPERYSAGSSVQAGSSSVQRGV
jgi:hypothetical protein